MYYSRSKIISELVEKLHKYKIMLKDILTCLVLDYRVASLITFTLLSYKSVLKKSDQSDLS